MRTVALLLKTSSFGSPEDFSLVIFLQEQDRIRDNCILEVIFIPRVTFVPKSTLLNTVKTFFLLVIFSF